MHCWSIFNHRTCGINFLYDRSSSSPLIKSRKVVSDSGGARFKSKTLCSYPNSPSDSTLRYATRGHRNEVGCVSVNGVEPEENDGNFRALLRYRIRGEDNQLASFVKNAKQNATYHSAEIQNETIDRQKREFSAIVIRYAYVKEGKWVCVEDPLAVMDIIQRATAQYVQGELRITGSVIGSIFLSIVKELGLNLSRCVGQGYNGASVLASDRVCASSKFRSESNHI